MFKKWISHIIDEQIKKKFEPIAPAMPIGYTPLPAIRGAVLQWVYVPFNSKRVWCRLRSLNANQIQSCGDFSMLSIFANKNSPPTQIEIMQMRNAQERLAKAVMNNPTYAEYEKLLFEDDNIVKENREKLKQLKKHFEANKNNLTLEQTKELTRKIERLEFFLGFLLPEDTAEFLTAWALGADVSEIKSLTRDTLLKAAILAKNSNKAVSDFLSGVFTDRDKTEIETAAWIIFNEWSEAEKLKEKNAAPKSKRSKK
jgi:hypothetical protein